jgi:GNAT superfamily N-acetyltransferase
MRQVDAVRTYLAMTSPPGEPIPFADPRCRVERVSECPASFYRFLYDEVGRPWQWLERRPWSDHRILAHLGRPGLELWVLYCAGAPAGFFELERQGSSVQLSYFGLLPEFIGRGLGRPFLSAALSRAWRAETSRVWLHTCTLDHSRALPNYLRLGFQIEREERYVARIEDLSARDRADAAPQSPEFT